MRLIPRPQAEEYASYARIYMDLLPDDGRVLQYLAENINIIHAAVTHLTEAQLITPHSDGEWTIKEILLHIVDDERIYAYRALRFARGDSTELPGFNHDIMCRRRRLIRAVWQAYSPNTPPSGRQHSRCLSIYPPQP